MKAVIFAGGVGTRLWPLSRRHSPKQFEKVIGEKSTLQLAVERLLTDFSWEDIYISTSDRYVDLVSGQLPKIPLENIIGEPESKDVGPAVGLVTAHLFKKHPNTPVVILWSDHMIKETELFLSLLRECGYLISGDNNKMIFISQKPRFASQNLGWIKFGNQKKNIKNLKLYAFESFHYRPDIETAEKFLKHGHYAWNVGYFVTTPKFLWGLYEKFQPDIFNPLNGIYKAIGSGKYAEVLKVNYSRMPKISFDNALLEKIQPQDAYVISEDLGWSDIGAWEALKEALQMSPDQNVTQGKVLLTDCKDTLVYNYTDQMVVTIDLNGFLVINTHDAVLVCHKNSVPKIKKLVEGLANSENEHLV